MKTRKTIKMENRNIWLTIISLLISISVHSQCNQRLVDIAAEQAGSNAIYIRDFKVKLSKGSMDNPNPTGKFPIYLNKGVKYRFTVANAGEFEGKAYIELMRRSQLYADNFSEQADEYINTFDFECPRSATYQLLLNFGMGREGCAAIVMSMVYQDSMAYIEPGVELKSDSLQTLYLWTKNKLQIASTQGRGANLEVQVSQGKVSRKGVYYEVTPDKTGTLTVKVDVFDKEKLLESDSVVYMVEYPPLPRIILPGSKTIGVSGSELVAYKPVELEYTFEVEESPYQLKSFYISKDIAGLYKELSVGDRLSRGQINLIKSLGTDGQFYIHDAIFIDPEGKEHRSGVIEMLVTD